VNPLPLVSVVTVSYNQASFIEQTIQSIICQSYPHIEYIIVDGGSTDLTHQIIDKYRSNIDVLIVECDRGPAEALNKGFKAATGDYLSFLNSDDIYDPAFVATMLSRIHYGDSDLIYSDVRFIDKDSLPIKPYRFPLAYAVSISPKKLFAKACIIPQQGSIWSRRVYDAGVRFNEDNTTCWDLEFFVDVLCAGFCCHSVHQCLSSFRLHESSISGEVLFSSYDHTNSRAKRRQADHARIKSKLIECGYECGHVECFILRLDNLIRKMARVMSPNG